MASDKVQTLTDTNFEQSVIKATIFNIGAAVAPEASSVAFGQPRPSTKDPVSIAPGARYERRCLLDAITVPALAEARQRRSRAARGKKSKKLRVVRAASSAGGRPSSSASRTAVWTT